MREQDHMIVNGIFERIKEHVPPNWSHGENYHSNPCIFTDPCLRFITYGQEGKISRHKDDVEYPHGGELTVLVYLNDDYVEGHTYFNSEKRIKFITPATGKILVFDKLMAHGAVQVKSGTKIVMQFSIYYKKERETEPGCKFVTSNCAVV